ncbi:hypothetical protein EG68_06236 [Paragonimus skrjabini miyazakii]|uniref:CCHC-type domain-containing protein n=1 Tax=Paragonimus skrjabini miyazakii TaxID=59628 RepID=A0A8S9Y8M5_9TREM|nr:hypothetical protein EG68_06236 [Paragonimus skrjabini miyazakii]
MADNLDPLTSRRKQRTRGRGVGSRPLDSERRITDASQIPIEKLTYLNNNHIYWKSSNSRRSFLCQACGISLSSLGACFHHADLTFHCTNLLMYQLRLVLLHLPPITTAHRIALNQALESALEGVLVDSDEVQRRQQFAEKIMTALKDRIPSLEIVGMGCTWNGLAFPDSTVDLDLCRSAPDSKLSQNPKGSSRQLFTLVVPDDSFVHTPGLGYLMEDVFNTLKASTQNVGDAAVTSTPNKRKSKSSELPRNPAAISEASDGLSPFPEIHNVTRMDFDNFCIMFSDTQGVNYSITTGNPCGHLWAKLVHTYLNLDRRAFQLAVLFRKLSKMAYLDLPLHGTFPAIVLPIMVIFYLQHTSPPLLPNLHQLWATHQSEIHADQFHEVCYRDRNLSFLTDPECISTFWLTNKVSSDAAITPDLTDLWLGLLRFYLFDFQKTRCAVDIMSVDPVARTHHKGGKSSLEVLDPFDPSRNLCQHITSNGFEYIHSQLSAAYGYFGVPRLTNGRHLFTNVRTREVPVSDTGAPVATAVSEKQSASGTPLKSPTVHLTPILDDTNGFAGNWIKLKCLLAEKFTAAFIKQSTIELSPNSITCNDCPNSLDVECDGSNCLGDICSTNSSKKLPLTEMVPHIMGIVLDEVLETDDISAVIKGCLKLYQKSLYGSIPADTLLSLAEYQAMAKPFAKDLWTRVCVSFVNKGVLTVGLRDFCRTTAKVFRESLSRWSRVNQTSLAKSTEELLMHPDAIDAASDKERNVTVGNQPLGNTSPSIRTTNSQTDAALPQSCFDSNKAEVSHHDNDDEEYDLGTSYSDAADELSDRVEFANEFVESTHILEETIESEQLFDEQDDNADEQCEFAECTLDLGDDGDDVDVEVDGGHTSGSVTPNNHVNFADKCSTIQINDPDNSLDDIKSSRPSASQAQKTTTPNSFDRTQDIPVESLDPGADKLKAEKRAVTNLDGTTGPKTTHKSRTAVKSKERPSIVLGWDHVIVTRDAVTMPVDDDRPDFYHSARIANLKPEHLSFPFVARGKLPAFGRHGIRSSVLGLASPNEPSTLLAHFECPEPECIACGQAGHRRNTCASTIDKTVSFCAWQKLRATLPTASSDSASEHQLIAIGECLSELDRVHDCAQLEAQRKLIVGALQRLFATQFPSVCLELFGSCANGFELPSSDMDLCVFFQRNSPEWHQLKTVDGTLKLIREFRNKLFRFSNILRIVHVRPILHAKVPILKVRFENGLEADISFSNYLALINTRMLKFYTKVEPWLRTLGIALKIVGKLCHIANASTGGVSSYALIIMLIHYLQQKNQLPVLQQLHDGSETPVNLISGWNAWFQDDLSVVTRLWGAPKRKMSLGEMWLGFFRQKQLLPRFVKMWNSLLAIEDPFNLDHNLTGSLSRDSLLSILDVFYAVLKHHTTLLPDSMPPNIWRYSLFSPSSLAENRSHGPPPKSRCYRCQECGHRAADCPRNYTRGLITAVSVPVDNSIDVLIGPLLTSESKGLLNSVVQQPHPYPQQLQQKQNVSDKPLASQQCIWYTALQQPRTPTLYPFPRFPMVSGLLNPPRPRPQATIVTSNYGHSRDSGRAYYELSLNPGEVPVQCAPAYRTPFYSQTLYNPRPQTQTPRNAQEASTVQPSFHAVRTDGPQHRAKQFSARSPKKDPPTPFSCDSRPLQRNPSQMGDPVKFTTNPSPNSGRDDEPENRYLARNVSELVPTVSVSDTLHGTVPHTALSVSSNQRPSKRKRNRAKPPSDHAANPPETFDGQIKETNHPTVQPTCPTLKPKGNSRRKKFTRSTAEARSILNNKADVELVMQFQQMATNNIKPNHPGSFSR